MLNIHKVRISLLPPAGSEKLAHYGNLYSLQLNLLCARAQPCNRTALRQNFTLSKRASSASIIHASHCVSLAELHTLSTRLERGKLSASITLSSRNVFIQEYIFQDFIYVSILQVRMDLYRGKLKNSTLN